MSQLADYVKRALSNSNVASAFLRHRLMLAYGIGSTKFYTKFPILLSKSPGAGF